MSEKAVLAPAIAAPDFSKKERHGNELRRDMEEALAKVSKGIDAIASMIESGRIGKSELRAVVGDMRVAVGNLPANVEYAMKTFNQAAEAAVDDAKTEIEAHLAGMATRLGMDSLRGIAPAIEGRQTGEAKDRQAVGGESADWHLGA